ncbi:alpha-N-acetyl-neuraminyl-2,3-beta-galactosyl-1,3-N-acetyl-galactosaminide alpha-2,6-sialyltransferase-like [Branchiostoma lanceolatum]|uniref:alpha-N-acetyl-neuraminyl-2,3-beta-galactosyl-1, 3-N-acetyl-galactosaminide alpha-2,6-sialyltransferase-like n=1 Tax=Branchiostoma lanceolatum TaxID=7740 RepID=UPI003453E618
MALRRLAWLMMSLFLVGLTYILLTTERSASKWEMTSKQTEDQRETLEKHVKQERNPESVVEPPKTHSAEERNPESAVELPKSHSAQERNPESVIGSPKKRDPEPIDPMNPLKGYVGVPDESKQLNMSCGVCAFVTGSGRMLNYKAGNEIDQADCVIRMNEGPVVGYEEQVGSKTTLRVMCFQTIYMVPMNATIFAGKSTLLGWGPLRDMDTEKGKAYQKLKELQISYPDLDVYKLTEDRMRYAESVFVKETGRPWKDSGTWLSTGWWTMMVAMEICDVIKVYGMTSDDFCKNHPNDQTFYHYFTGSKYPMEDYRECQYQKRDQNARGGGHRFLTEKAIFARWAPLNNITFLNPSWNP